MKLFCQERNVHGQITFTGGNPLLYDGTLLHLVLGTLMAGLVGYICLRILIRMVNKGQLYFFSPYCWMAGCVTILLSFLLN